MFPKLTNKKMAFVLLMLILISAPFANAVVLESGIPGQLPPGTTTPNSIAVYINYLYLFVLGVVGIAVFASLVFWGVVWISSGIADKRGMALGKIKDAFTGLAIALGAYIILNTINPDLLTLKDLKIGKVEISAKPSTHFTWIIGENANCDGSFCEGMQSGQKLRDIFTGIKRISCEKLGTGWKEVNTSSCTTPKPPEANACCMWFGQ